jgi:tetratricopeptide (TPR) repeat protein
VRRPRRLPVSLALALVAGVAVADDERDESLWSDVAGTRRGRAAELVAQASAVVDAYPRDAAILLEESIALDARRPLAYYLLGVARFRERSWEPCADALQELARLEPGFTPPPRREGPAQPAPDDLLGMCLALSGRHDAAIALYRRLLLEPSGDAGIDTLHGNLGDCYLALGRIDDAIAEYQAALSLAPRRALYYFGLAVAYDRDQRASRAAWAMGRALELDANLVELGSPGTYFVPAEDVHYYHGLAHQVAAAADPPRRLTAIAYFRKYLALAPPGPWAERASAHLAELGSPLLTARDVTVHPHGAEADALARRVASLGPELARCLAGSPHVAMRLNLSLVVPPPPARRVAAAPAIAWSSQGPDPPAAEIGTCLEKKLQGLRLQVDKLTRIAAVVVSR